MEFKTAQLDNGLKVIAEVKPSAASLAAGFFVRTGSRDETPGISGVSHFLEHMVFKGTARRTPLDVNREFDEMGATYNAFTSEENTVFFGAVVPEFQDRLVDLLADILRPSLRGEDFDMEKNVIVDEIARYEDQPSFKVYEELMGQHFADHPLGAGVLGTADSIRQLQRDDMQAYFERRYSPTNVTVVGVGNLDFGRLVDSAAGGCNAWKAFDVSRDLPPSPSARSRRVLTDAKIAREHIALMSDGPAAQDDRRFAAQLLAAIVGDSTGSRLFYALIEPALADEAHMSYDPMDGAGGFITFLSTDPKRADAVVNITRREFETFCQDGPTDAELQAAKNKIASGATLKGEVPMGRLTAVGFDWVYRHQYIPLAEQIEQLFAVTSGDVVDLARACRLADVSLTALGPLETL